MPSRPHFTAKTRTAKGLHLSVLLLCAFPFGVQAWGPHAEITQAALDVLGTNHPLVLHLGAQAQRLTNYCWMADFRRLPFKEPEEDMYANDYLLFPGMDTHLDHICPEVKKSYRPYFERALQALRQEDRRNAARWIGSLLHFVQDSGSPPHGAEIRGAIHTKMENWVDAKRIQIRGYAPRLLGTNEAGAREGFLRRMDELIAFSKERGQKLRVPVEIGNRTAVMPVVLESALESSRVTADLLHTLGEFVPKLDTNRATLRGIIVSRPAVGFERFAAKLMFEGTNISTLTDVSGHYELRNLPPGEWRIAVLKPGGEVVRATVVLQAGRTNVLDLTLSKTGETENLIRNGNSRLTWVRKDAPDCWFGTGQSWEGEVIPLKNGQHYKLVAKFKEAPEGDVFLRWTRQLPYTLPQNAALPKIDSQPLTPQNSELSFVGSPNMALLQVTIRTRKTPGDVCESITLVPSEESAPQSKR
jgi:Carboxypeptidase regulatory-like domain